MAIIVAAVMVGLVATTSELRVALGIVAVVLLIALLVAIVLCRRNLAEHPDRIASVSMVEIAAFVGAVVVVLTVVVNAVAWAADRYPAKGPAYLFGLVAGAAVGYFSREIFKPVEDRSWIEVRYLANTVRLYKQYFYRFDQSTKKYMGGELARWPPDGRAADALRANQYCNERGKNILGWNSAARRSRSATIKYELNCIPWNPPP